MKVVLSAAEMASADQYTIHELGIPGLELMERAARAATDELIKHLKPDDHIVVAAGPGNNGGDGFAIARLLKEADYSVRVIHLSDRANYRGDALANLKLLDGLVQVDRLEHLTPDLLGKGVTWIVDALFGTGLSRPLIGPYALLVELLNQHPASVLAVDLPSGLFGDSGRLPGPCVLADVTVTFQHLKVSHTVSPAINRCGPIVVHDIGIRVAPDYQPTRYLLEASDYARKPRPASGHKGSFGTLAVIGGFSGMEGAANLCALAALRFGAGKVRIYSDRISGRFRHDSVMVASLDQLTDLDAYDALVIGPGLSREPSVWAKLEPLDLTDKAVVWDADGLHYLAKSGMKFGDRWVMTPHPGEAAKLLGQSATAVQKDRLLALTQLQALNPRAWFLLKGQRTLVAGPSEERFICGTGNPALATAGSGDVLAGMIGALLAQGYPCEDAVLLACIRHGIAADRWVQKYRDYSMLAEDIIDDLRI